VSQDVIFNISNNINEDDLRYYSGYWWSLEAMIKINLKFKVIVLKY
jgi:hypothetical protein